LDEKRFPAGALRGPRSGHLLAETGGVNDVRDLEAIRGTHTGAVPARLSALVDRPLDRAHHLAEPADQTVLSALRFFARASLIGTPLAIIAGAFG
jgi:hypothetical protein